MRREGTWVRREGTRDRDRFMLSHGLGNVSRVGLSSEGCAIKVILDTGASTSLAGGGWLRKREELKLGPPRVSNINVDYWTEV